MTREEISARLEELRGGIQYLAAFDQLDDEQRSAWDDATVEFEELSARAQDIEDRAAAAERASKVPTIQVITKPKTEDVLNDRAATPSQMVDAVTRGLEDRGVEGDAVGNARMLLKRHASDDPMWAKGLAARSTDEYASGFSKVMTGRDAYLTAEERTAMSVVTAANGGHLVPTHLDPTLLFTNTSTSNAVRGISNVVTLTTGNVWNGVTTAGSTFSFDGELAEVSDDTPTVGRVSIPVFKAQGFVQASLEVLQDTNIVGDLQMIFSDGRDRLEGAAHVTGNGTSAPKGILTLCDANTNTEIATTTANTLGAVDIDALYRKPNIRHRAAGKFLIHPYFEGKIRLLASTLGSQFTVDLTQAYTSSLYGKPVVESDDMPSTALTTTGQNIAIYGDFSQYKIVDMPGSFSLTYVPVMFNTANNLPDGRVGWYAAWRTGADAPVSTGSFGLLQNA